MRLLPVLLRCARGAARRHLRDDRARELDRHIAAIRGDAEAWWDADWERAKAARRRRG